MKPFKLHPQLQQDCHVIAHGEDSHLLLLDNSHFSWFLLVPVTDQRELHHLPNQQKQQVLAQIDTLAHFVEKHFATDKLNIGAIGNMVSQLHIHVIGRRHNDPCWPGVVWGRAPSQSYAAEEVQHIKELVKQHGLESFTVQ